MPPVDLVAHVAAQLRGNVFPGAHLVLGLSGGMDSVSLLQILAELAPPMRFSFRALHVNHGISPNAAYWAQFCQRLCESLKVPLAVEAVDLAPFRRLGPEAAARAARWAVFRRHAADFLVLAQHRDDQAETLLLQLLRGAGPAGLAGMGSGLALEGASAAHAQVLRPLLEVSRAEVELFVRARGHQWIDDESNDSVDADRNFLRHRVLPVISRRFAHSATVIARSARILAESAQLLGELGRQDLVALDCDGALDLAGLRALGAARARNALREYCVHHGIAVPGYRLLLEIWRQINGPRKDDQTCLEWDGVALRRYRGRIYIEKSRASALAGFEPVAWNGEPCLPLTAPGGFLNFKPEEGRGLSLDRLRSAPVTVRLRQGGERLQPDPRRPRRTLKNLWQEQGLPPWWRDAQPLVYCGEQLVCVPGLGEEYEWRARPGERGLIVSWDRY